MSSPSSDEPVVIDLTNLDLANTATIDVEVETEVLDTDVGRAEGYLELLQSRPDPLGAFLPFEQLKHMFTSPPQTKTPFVTPVVLGSLNYDDTATNEGQPFVAEPGPHALDGDRDYLFQFGDKFISARGPLKAAAISKGMIAGRSRAAIQSIVPKTGGRTETSKAQKLVYEGASLLMDLEQGSTIGQLEDAACPYPSAVLGVIPLNTPLPTIAEELSSAGRSLSYMVDEDWTLFQKESTARSARYTAQARKPRASSVTERVRPPPFVSEVDLVHRAPSKKDSERLKGLSTQNAGDEGASDAWTLGTFPTAEDVVSARTARATYAKRTSRADATSVLATDLGELANATRRRFAMHDVATTAPKLDMTAVDVPLPDDEGIEDEVVAENVEGSAAAIDLREATVEDVVLGSRKAIADVVAKVVNGLGVALDAQEKERIVEEIVANTGKKVVEHDAKVQRLVQMYGEKGLNDEMAKLVAMDEVTSMLIVTEISDIVMETAFDTMISFIHKSAVLSRPSVKRLNSKYGSALTVHTIVAPAGEPSLLEYVARVVSELATAGPDGPALNLTYAETRKYLERSLKAALIRDDVGRSVAALASSVVETHEVPVWANLKPDMSDAIAVDLATKRLSPIEYNLEKSAPLPISYDTEAIVDQAKGAAYERIFEFSENVIEVTQTAADATRDDAAATDVSSVRETALKNGVPRHLVDSLDHADEESLFVFTGQLVPGFMSLMMVDTLRPWQVAGYGKNKDFTTIMDTRKELDRTAFAKLVVPHPSGAGVPKDQRDRAIYSCYAFLNDLFDVGGFPLVKTFLVVHDVLTKKTDADEEARILETRREAVKMARQAVRQNLPSELQWMYNDLKDQGVIDVARDAVMDEEGTAQDAAEAVPAEGEEDRQDGYDLDEFSDDE